MPLEITVGLPQLVVHHGQTVMVAEPDGQFRDPSTRGLLFRDTRLISYWQLFANGERWELMNGGAFTHFAAKVFLTNPAIPSVDGEIAARSLSLVLGRWVSGGMHEDLDITNHAMVPVRFNLELAIRSDFADIFEVKSGRLVRRGRITTAWSHTAQTLRTSYVNQDFQRGIVVTVHADSAAVNANGRLSFDVALAPGASWHACLLTDILDDGTRIAAPDSCIDQAMDSAPKASLRAWRARATKLATTTEIVQTQFAQAIDDVAALRLPVAQDGGTYMLPAAGLPWFLVPFGRDSLVVSLQCLPVTDEFARGALAVLGARQSRIYDPARDAEPGKILHEMRTGEMATLHEVPFGLYYGSVDSTPLFVILAGRYAQATGDLDTLRSLWPAIDRALGWIDGPGDRDHDGFVEYFKATPRGLSNQGWKDSYDSVFHADGRLAEGPIALAEVQGYVYAAKKLASWCANQLGFTERARQLHTEADQLAERFEDAYWCEEIGTYALALDGDKRPCRVATSNAGQVLFSEIARSDRAERIGRRLMEPNFFSGWGVRTVAVDEARYNPMSYHNGSVWPHDNAMIATGLARYGDSRAATRIFQGMFDAATYMDLRRLPELFCGFPRFRGRGPTLYPVACAPQSWSSGAFFALLQASLGIEQDPFANVIRFRNPKLPAFLDSVVLRGLKAGTGSVDLSVRRQGDDKISLQILSARGDIEVTASFSG